MSSEFPSDLRQFIANHIESLAQLESLLLCRRNRERSCSVDEIAKAMYISPEMAAAILRDLQRRGFVIPSLDDADSFRYQAQAETDQLVERLGQLYEERRVAVITEIYSKPANQAQVLADAFRFRREDKK